MRDLSYSQLQDIRIAIGIYLALISAASLLRPRGTDVDAGQGSAPHVRLASDWSPSISRALSLCYLSNLQNIGAYAWNELVVYNEYDVLSTENMAE
jgi:hypothetical protein